MGGGGGTKSSSTSISGSAQKWAQPFAKAGASSVQSVFNQAQPGLQQLTGMVNNDLVPSLIGQYKGGMGAAQKATSYNDSVLSGNYMGKNNPYLQGIIGTRNQGIMESLGQTMSMNGRYGSEVHQGELAKQIAAADDNLLYSDYGAERDRMAQAAQGAGSQNLANVAQALSGIGMGAELPYTGANSLAQSLGALFNGGTSTSSSVTKGPGLLQSLLVAGAQGASAAAMCDIRAKENIKLYNVESDGLPIYSFTYKPGFGPEGTHINPMAQDVAKFRPWALGPEQDGYMTIYPDKL